MKTLWIKIKNFFKARREDEAALESVLEAQILRDAVEKQINVLFKDVGNHIDKRVENMLKARAASKDKAAKQAYNGTIKELRTVKDLIFGS